MKNITTTTLPIRKKIILKIYREKSNVSDTYLKNLLAKVGKRTEK